MDTDDGKVAVNMIRFMNHYARTVAERALIIDFLKKNKFVPPKRMVDDATGAFEDMPGAQAFKDWGEGKGIHTAPFMSMMNDYFAVGFANTLGYAHANTGDTMTSVMIGGLRTVMNGDFEIFPGDLVQFYWCAACIHSPSFLLFLMRLSLAGRSRRTISFRTGAGSSTCPSGKVIPRATWTRPSPSTL
jgi:hypothetical protein